MRGYLKALVAALTAGGVALQAALTDDAVTSTEWVTIGLAVVGAVAVLLVPNKQTPAT